MTPPSFSIMESLEFGGSQRWRLKGGEIRYRGSGEFAGLIRGRIPIDEDQANSFFDALDLLEVWGWQENYRPEDIGWGVMDGSTWSFEAAVRGRKCRTGGSNGYPSYASAGKTSLEPERYGLLMAAFRECFRIEHHFVLAQDRHEKDSDR